MSDVLANLAAAREKVEQIASMWPDWGAGQGPEPHHRAEFSPHPAKELAREALSRLSAVAPPEGDGE